MYIYTHVYMYMFIYMYIYIQVDSKTQVGFSEVLGQVGHTTLRDVSFRHSYGRPLAEVKTTTLVNFMYTHRYSFKQIIIYSQLYK
jgi:hypothetical protein